MMRLVFSDLRDHAVTWLGAFFVAVGCGYIGGWAASIGATMEPYPNLQDLPWMVLVFSSLAAAAVLVPAANLTVSVQRRSYALWQLVNVSPRLVSAVVIAQLAVVAVAGAVCGTLLEAATYVPLFPLVFSSRYYQPIDHVVLEVGLPLFPLVWFGVVGVFVLGGLRGARSAGETPPLVALNAPEPTRKGMTWLRIALFAGLAFGDWQLASFMVGSGADAALDMSLFLPVLMIAMLVPLAPLVFSIVLRAWTSLVPKTRWNAWYLARHTARYGLSASTSVETPVMVGFGLVAGVFSLSGVLGAYVRQQGMTGWSTSLDFTSSLLLLGGPILLCAIGAAVSVVMTSRSRTRDVALLIASGARPQTMLGAAVCEALIHAVTATFVGAAAVVASNAVIAYAVGLPLFANLAFGEGLVVSLAGFVLVLTATLVPTCAALNKEPASVLTLQE